MSHITEQDQLFLSLILQVHRKPEKLKDSEASCLLYAGLTAWSALKITGELMVLSPQGRSVLVLGASGGVGSLAVQMLNAWGAQVML